MELGFGCKNTQNLINSFPCQINSLYLSRGTTLYTHLFILICNFHLTTELHRVITESHGLITLNLEILFYLWNQLCDNTVGLRATPWLMDLFLFNCIG